jgi:NADPH2:quinone reductase
MKSLQIATHSQQANDIHINLLETSIPTLGENDCLIKVFASGINPSDALAACGYFNHAILPRIPGRDFAGKIVDGPKDLIGKDVWGTGGAAGISFDGTQAEYIKLSTTEIAESPHNLNLTIAGSQPLPYVTAYYSLVKRAHITKNEAVLVAGALGQVGSAAMSICSWKNCNAIALVRGKNEVEKANSLGWNVINSEDDNLHEKILAANHGKPISVILNSLGNLYWKDFIASLAEFGRIITIGARENLREANINLFELYRSNQDIIGINTVSLNFSDNAKLLNELKIGFDENKLIPLAVEPAMIFTPENASLAYRAVMDSSIGKRVAIEFNREE